MNPFVKMLMGIIFTLIISGIVGLIGIIFKEAFLFWFLISFVFQFVIFIVVNNILRFMAHVKMKQWELDIQKEMNKNRVDMECAACNETNTVILNIKEDNKFTCKSCGVENSVILHYSNAQKTNPIYKQNILTMDDVKKLQPVKHETHE